jgi:hypothetical protein
MPAVTAGSRAEHLRCVGAAVVVMVVRVADLMRKTQQHQWRGKLCHGRQPAHELLCPLVVPCSHASRSPSSWLHCVLVWCVRVIEPCGDLAGSAPGSGEQG